MLRFAYLTSQVSYAILSDLRVIFVMMLGEGRQNPAWARQLAWFLSPGGDNAYVLDGDFDRASLT